MVYVCKHFGYRVQSYYLQFSFFFSLSPQKIVLATQIWYYVRTSKCEILRRKQSNISVSSELNGPRLELACRGFFWEISNKSSEIFTSGWKFTAMLEKTLPLCMRWGFLIDFHFNIEVYCNVRLATAALQLVRFLQ